MKNHFRKTSKAVKAPKTDETAKPLNLADQLLADSFYRTKSGRSTGHHCPLASKGGCRPAYIRDEQPCGRCERREKRQSQMLLKEVKGFD
ncbi:hypothetical protein ANO11243_034990 [Dothideomycetidae sp. 11243]|nr:hypothetical protein ANO11243_034990 [fungal sp. No.11243]